MAIEKRNLGTEDDGDIIQLGSGMEVMQEPSRQDLIECSPGIGHRKRYPD